MVESETIDLTETSLYGPLDFVAHEFSTQPDLVDVTKRLRLFFGQEDRVEEGGEP